MGARAAAPAPAAAGLDARGLIGTMADVPLPADHPFVRDLAAGPANHVPLSPVAFLERSAAVCQP